MTSLINTIEKLIKREKTTPERKKKDDSKKSSSEILSELFSAFNADPPKIDEVSVKKSKKSKKKHKKEKKKRSRSSSSSSDSDDSDYSHKRKKRKKSKSKKHKDRSLSRSRTPVTIKSETPKVKYEYKHAKSENAVEETKKEPKEKTKRRASIKAEDTNNIQVTVNSSDANLIPMPESPQEIKLLSKKHSRSSSSSSNSDDSDYSHKHKKRKKSKSKKHKDRSPSHSRTSVTIKSETPKVKYEFKHVKTENAVEETKTEPKEKTKRCTSIKVEDTNNFQVTVNSIDTSLIPMPESPQGTKPGLDDLRLKLESKKLESSADNDKCRSKIQIKNLKFSTVFEETVKKAEEEARKQAEKYEEGEYTGSSSSSAVEEVPNLEFPKSSNLGGMIKKTITDDNILRHETESSRCKKSKHSESSHRTSRRDRSRSRKRSHSKSRRSRSGSRRRRHRSHSKSRRRSRSRHRSTSRSKRRSNSRSRARARHHSPRHHSPKHRTRRSRSPTGVRLADSEKKRLLEVARRNAINMLKNGAVPAGAAALPPHTRTQVMAAIQSGGKSVDELTDFCKHLSKKEALGELSSVSSNDEGMSENEDTIAFHHPFLVKEKAPIVMNIRGGAPLPIKTNPLPIANKDELRLQFPVSSGTQHRDTEWVPVSPKKDNNMQVAKLNSKPAPKSTPQNSTDTSKPEPLAITAPPEPNPPPYMNSFTTPISLTTVPALPAPGPQAYPPGIEPPNIDVASIVSQKLSMIRREQEQLEISSSQGFGWSKDCALGQFTGSTGVQILTPRELASGTQAWAKKDQLVRAAPVEGGMGMHLLQKMGWTPGQGLGKEGTGTLQPLLLEVKLDTRGLQAKEEVSSRNNRHGAIKPQRHGGGRRGPAPLVAGGKHPVSLLGEYCSKRKLGPPEYNLCFECGPDHKKNFLFKVKVAGVEYQPAVASANKKQAKADAALLVLQKLGIVNQ